jgi:DNA-binding HxlR family transcriptional regulator
MNESDFGKCPYVTVQKLLSGKWTLIILFLLSNKTMRFNELHRELPMLTQATLTKQLRGLEKDGLIVRKVFNQIPPKVQYSLSEIGEKFRPSLETLKNWSEDYIRHMQCDFQP